MIKLMPEADGLILNGNCLDILKELEDNSVDSIVTDPPYELGFMDKSWDNTGIANNKEMWKECLRVLKPGGHLLAFSGTRTYHRMASAIEGAGFEIRDMIEWVYGCLSEDTEILTPYGWERYHIYKHLNSQSPIMIYDIENNIYKWEKPKRWSEYTLDKDTCYRIKSDTTDQLVSRNHRCIVEREGKLIFVKAEELSEMEYMPTLSNNFLGLEKGQSKVLFKKMQRILQGIRMEEMGKDRSIESKEQNKTLWRKESSMERRSNLFQNSWELFGSQICPMSKRIYSYGKEGWLCNGTPINNGKTSWKNITKSGSCASQRPQSCKQSDRELNSIQEQCRTQEARGYGITRAKVTKQEYSGIIFCPTVSTGCFIARRKGKIFITGNSGFPKSLNIGKAVDKLQGNEREVVGENQNVKGRTLRDIDTLNIGAGAGNNTEITKGTSTWEGWGTALKPAHEPICMARKPLAEKTVAENCLKWGTGGINIDESRVGTESESDLKELNRGNKRPKGDGYSENTAFKIQCEDREEKTAIGRFPANLIHDGSEEVRECFPESKAGKNKEQKGTGGIWSKSSGLPCGPEYGDNGNASRFFKSIIYQAKASKSERNEGMDELEEKEWKQENSPNPNRENRPFIPVKNNHPTVKPIALMEYLIKMVTPKGGIVLDPFAGSGTTLVASKKLGYKYIGIELTKEYLPIIEARLENVKVEVVEE